MALNVSYKNPYGYYTLKSADGMNEWRIDICRANCVCALVYFYTNDEGVDMVQLQGFFFDDVHAKRCIENDYFRDCYGFTFFKKELDARMRKVIKLLRERGFDVTIE